MDEIQHAEATHLGDGVDNMSGAIIRIRKFITNEDGTYDGEFLWSKEDGVGIYSYSNGDLYDGQWKSGLRHGKGRFRWQNGVEYYGDWKNGFREGIGKYTYLSKDFMRENSEII